MSLVSELDEIAKRYSNAVEKSNKIENDVSLIFLSKNF